MNGDAGLAGTSGLAGIAGEAGAEGSAGASGIGGVDGEAGASGIAGSTGMDGVQGIDGLPGAEGLAGTAGSTGAVGLSGESGSAGTAGADGGAGASGAAGAVGADGLAGVSGATGSAGTDGLGGVAIQGEGQTTVINAGTLSGGLAYDGVTRARAVEFTGGGNRLELEAGSVIEGDAVAIHDDGEIDTLALGGIEDGSFDVSAIGVQYQGFNAFDKSGSSVWTLEGETSEVTPWSLSEGVLAVSREESLGAESGSLTFDGGTLRVVGTEYGGTSREVTLLDGGGSFEIEEGAAVFTVESAITGSGDLAKLGEGTLVLNACNPITGTTFVDEGTLVIGSTEEDSGACVDGDAVVARQGTLAGFGTVGGQLSNEGTVSPGYGDGEVGTFSVGGDFTQGSGGTFLVDVAGDSNTADRLDVEGSATLDGALEVRVGGEPDWYHQHTVVDAEGGVNGEFATVATDRENVDGIVQYVPGEVQLELFRNDVVFTREVPNLTPNQFNTAGGLQGVDPEGEVYRNVLIAGKAQAPRTLDQLSGEGHAGLASAMVASERITRGIMVDRMRQGVASHAEKGTSGPSAPSYGDSKSGDVVSPVEDPRARGWELWAEGVSDELDLDGDSNAASVSQSLAGIYVGGNLMLGGGWVVGATYGHTAGDVTVSDRRFGADVENNVFGLSAGKQWEVSDDGLVRWVLGGSYTMSSIEAERSVAFGRLNERLSSEYDSTATQWFTEIGYEKRVASRTFLEPYWNLAWTSYSSDGYQERGGASALRGQGSDLDQVTSVVGVRVRREFDLGALPAWLQAGLGWQHVSGDLAGVSSHAFAGGPQFQVTGAAIDRESLMLNLGAGLRITDSLTVGASYTGTFSEQNTENTSRLHVEWGF